MLRASGSDVAVGIAMGDYVEELLRREPGLVDFVEVPLERLVHTPEVVDRLDVPVILHCASLSIAGDLPPDPSLIAQLRRWIEHTRTPWLGEHLAFVAMAGDAGDDLGHVAFAPSVDAMGAGVDAGGPYTVGYTVSPQYSEAILDRVVAALDRWEDELGRTVLIENGPVYFRLPGSSMGQVDFLAALCRRRPATRLLLDLAHLACTAANSRNDPHALLDAFPLDHVVEVHLSGAESEIGLMWDDHAAPIAPALYALLDRVLERVRPRAVTIEYNWDPAFPLDVLRADVARVREAVAIRLPAPVAASCA